jgi:hypothetical protein
MRNIILSLVLLLFATGVCSAQTVLYFPQFVDGVQLAAGVGWISVIAVTNTAALGTPAASGTVTLTNDNGTPLNLALTDENGQPAGNTFQLAGGQSKLFYSPQGAANGPLPFNIGFATLTSNLPVSATSAFIEFNLQGVPIAVAGVPASTPLTRQAIIATKDTGGSNTALAAANPGVGTATITFQLLDKSGTQIGSLATRTLLANSHTAFFLSELFPSAPTVVLGTLRITSDKAIVTTSLIFEGATFGTLPIFPLP